MLIVDAFNVLHAVPSVEPRLTGLTIDGLAGMLATGRYVSTDALLVIDGTGGGHARRSHAAGEGGHFGRVRLWYAGPGKDADSAIEQMLDQHQHQRTAHRCIVASNDRRVRAAGKAARAKTMSADELIREIMEDLRRQDARHKRITGNKPDFAADLPLDHLATAYWLRLFGVDAGGERKAVESTDRVEVPSPGRGKRAPTEQQRATPPARPAAGSVDTTRPTRRVGTPKPAASPQTSLEWLIQQAQQEWGERIDPDDLDMAKWLRSLDASVHAQRKKRT